MTVGATPPLRYHMEAPSFNLERSAAGGAATSLDSHPNATLTISVPRSLTIGASTLLMLVDYGVMRQMPRSHMA